MFPNKSISVLAPTFACGLAIALAAPASGAILTYGATAPVVNNADIASFVGATADANNVNGGDDNATYVAANRPAAGETFTTLANANGYTLTAITLQNVTYTRGFADNITYGTFTIRVGTVTGGTAFTALVTDTVGGTTTNGFTGDGTGNYITFTLANPLQLTANTVYGFDVASNGGFFETNGTNASNPYAGGTAYSSGANGVGGATITAVTSDRVFHLDMTANVPEPSTLALAAAGAIALFGFCRRRSRAI